jgi:ribonuclease-3
MKTNSENNSNSDDDIEMHNVHNKKNRLINKDFINKILKRFGIKATVNNLDIWQRAFVHKSYCMHRRKKFKNEDFSVPVDGFKYIPLQEKSCESLEWLGDGVIQSITAQYLFSRYPEQNEGFLTKTRSKLVRTEGLARFSRYLKFQKHIMISKYMDEQGNGRENPKILEDIFEAFIGAMSLDLGNNHAEGYSVCHEFIVKIYERVIDFAELIQKDDNYKDQLMRYCHQQFNGNNPKYINSKIDSEGKERTYTEIIKDIGGTNKIVGKGVARSRKEAQQEAAKKALKYYKVI